MQQHVDAAGIVIRVGDKVTSLLTAGIYEVESLDNEAHNIIYIKKDVGGKVRRQAVYTFYCNINNHPRAVAGYEHDAR